MTTDTDIDVAVVGAVALDEIHSQAGDIDQLLGGSAVYASLAASILARVAPISVIGDDFDPALLQPLTDQGVSLDGIERAEGPNFRWGCRYSADGDVRETLYTRAGVYDTHPIRVSDPIRRARFVLLTAGNPDQNHRAMEQMIDPELVAIDTIEREVAERRDEFRAQLHHADLVSINTLEAAHLIQWPGDESDPALPMAAWDEISDLGPKIFILKKASLGVEIFERERRTVISAVPNVAATDPTGAGDTFISSLLSALARGCDLIQSAVWGCAAASFAIEAFGIQGILRATRDAVAERTSLITVNDVPSSTLIPPSR
ncbi:MAG: PfkB family carbohydrate kinase [Chloroflexi bacterium]|nr:PfkB family carbohydrate kinase [Chloroflexota bacterium]